PGASAAAVGSDHALRVLCTAWKCCVLHILQLRGIAVCQHIHHRISKGQRGYRIDQVTIFDEIERCTLNDAAMLVGSSVCRLEADVPLLIAGYWQSKAIWKE